MFDLLFTGRQVERKKAGNDRDRDGDRGNDDVAALDVPHAEALNARRSLFSCGASDPE
ncbi:MAG TPA: hypothetical protein VI258_04290 [Rhodanobacteraceae bacterium]